MKLSLKSKGRDPLAHLRQHMARVEAPKYFGSWAVVEVQPDLFSPQRFCVGIVMHTGSGRLLYRMISDAKKFECVYGTSAVVTDLIKEAELTLDRAIRDRAGINEVDFGTHNLALSTPLPASGVNEDAALERLFREIVVMEPSEQRQKGAFEPLDTKVVRSLVDRELKRIAGLAHAQIVVGTDDCIISDGEELHTLDVTYRSARGVGNLVSAVVKTPDTADLNVLRGVENLETFARIKNLNDRALFIMSAKADQLAPADYQRVMDRIGEHEWRLEKRGVRVVTFDEPAPIAQAVVEWAGINPN